MGGCSSVKVVGICIATFLVLAYAWLLISMLSDGTSMTSTTPSAAGAVYIATPATTTYPTDENNYYVQLSVSSTLGLGNVILHVNRTLAPLGAERFELLVSDKFYDNARFFRVIKNFMAQTGIHADPNVTKTSRIKYKPIKDDPVLHSNSRGTVSFAMGGKNSRTTQLFFNVVNNVYLDREGFAPFALVVSGMEHIDALYSGYGEGGKGDGTDKKGPAQGKINRLGNKYLAETFPLLSYINTARLLQ